jgi:hypothetical protein
MIDADYRFIRNFKDNNSKEAKILLWLMGISVIAAILEILFLK